MSVVWEEPREGNIVQFDFFSFRQAGIDDSHKVTVKSAPPQATIGIRYTAAHAAAEAAGAAGLIRDVVVRKLSGLLIQSPHVRAGSSGAEQVVLRVRGNVV